MKRLISMLCMALACSVALAAQSSTSDKIERKAERKADRKGEVLVTGCVADKDSRGHYLLSNASANNATAGTTGRDVTATTTTDVTASSYELSGDDIKAHVGQKVEVAGTIDARKSTKLTKKEAKDTTTAAIDTMPAQVLKVRSIRMIASKCQ